MSSQCSESEDLTKVTLKEFQTQARLVLVDKMLAVQAKFRCPGPVHLISAFHSEVECKAEIKQPLSALGQANKQHRNSASHRMDDQGDP